MDTKKKLKIRILFLLFEMTFLNNIIKLFIKNINNFNIKKNYKKIKYINKIVYFVYFIIKKAK